MTKVLEYLILKVRCTSLWVFAELCPFWWQVKLQPEVCTLMNHTDACTSCS